MNKTFSVNISGLIFNIEEEAYQALSQYLETLKSYLKNSHSREEILADIESRIAELFTLKISDRKQAIVKSEVEEIIAILGQPEDFMLDDEDLNTNPTTEPLTEEDLNREKLKKRVYRNGDDKIAGGVLSGLAAYFNHDPILWRLIFAVIVFLGWGSPIFFYLILWIIIPEAKTRAEKLQMRGEAVTVESLKRSVEEETEHLRRKAANLADAGTGAKLKGAVQEIVQFFVTALGLIFKVLGKVIAAFLIFLGVTMTFSVLFMWFSGIHKITFSDGLITPHQNLDELAQFLTGSESDADLIIIGGLLAFLTMSLGILFTGLRIISAQVKTLGRYNIGLILLALWIVGMTMMFIGGSQTVKDFSRTEQTVSTQVVPYQGDTLTLVLDEDHHPFSGRFADSGRDHPSDDILEIKDGMVYSADVRLRIEQIDSGRAAEIKVINHADGRNNLEALKRAEHIKYEWKCDSMGNLKFKEYILFPLKDKYRSQETDITLYLPVGKSIYLSPRTNRIFYNIKNVSNTWDHDMMGHTWTMTKAGLRCPDFKKEEDRWDP